ncbi:MAG: exonuclease SbcCD subunit D [Blautia sp.]|nr:exonuclease SbcCD subunit D [Blautia sp.]
MKILHTADWHIGKLLEGKSRLEEQRIVLEQFVSIADTTNADVICIAGDVFDNGHPSAGAEMLLYHTLKELSKQGQRLVVLIAGNHDQPSRLEAIVPLAREHGIIIYGTPRTKIPSGKYGNFEIESLEEGVFSFSCKGEKAVFACIPYVSEKTLNEVLYREEDSDEKRAADYAEKIGELFQKKASWYQEDTINVLVSHVFTLGCKKDGSEQGMMLGNSYLLSPEVFPEKAQYVALGHVHRPQKVIGSHGRIRYSGSPLPYRLQETVIAKQCSLVTLHPQEEAVVKEFYFDNPKPIEKWVCESYEEALKKCEENQNRPCYVYLQIYTDTYIREEQLKELKGYKEDILEVIPVFPETEQKKTGTVFTEKSFLELFLDYYQEKKGILPEEEILETLQEILKEEDENETDFHENERIK